MPYLLHKNKKEEKPLSGPGKVMPNPSFIQSGHTLQDIKSITKRVITEKDMMEFKRNGCLEVQITKGGILTDLAKEFALKNNIVIYRSN
jgi:hypothetical protein